MLYLILGTDKKKIDLALQKQGGEGAVKIDAFSWNADLIGSLVESDSLFGGGEKTVVMEYISESPEAFSELESMLQEISSSGKKFFVIESDLGDDISNLFDKSGANTIDLREKKSENKWGKKDDGGYNPFALADAVGGGSAKLAWIEYVRARLAGAEPEELHARVWGKVRDMLASVSTSPNELGIHPFVHKKAKSDLKNWKKEKLETFRDELVAVYHDSRLGGEGLDPALEKLLLSL